MIPSYEESVRQLFGQWDAPSNFSRNITFQVTEDCNLKCTYCYQTNKRKTMMTSEVGRAIVDYLFRLYDENNPEAFINQQTQVIILDFIGGEPFLNIELITEIVDYFWSQAILRRSIWAETFRISMATNGLLYFEPKVQEFIKKYINHLSLSISIDGDKNVHDACRLDHAGNGSFDRAVAALHDFNSRYPWNKATKATIAPENLDQIVDIITFFTKEGFTQINANTVYEADWTIDEAKKFYTCLKQIADFILEQENKELSISLFDEIFFQPMDESDNKNWCGGTGAMLAFDPRGQAYPCIRYMDTSLNGVVEPLVIGDCFKGLYQNDRQIEIRDMLDSITRRSQSTDECFYCPIAHGCAWCSAECYQRFGTPNKRNTSSCWMHRARSLANVYYWNKKYRKENASKVFVRHLPDDLALQIISEDELKMLDDLIER